MVNKVILLGRVGKDPELTFTQSGTEVCKFSVATSEAYKKKDGSKEEKTEWHKIVAWGSLAKICGEYVTKGMMVYIEGKMTTREWEGKDGSKHQTTEVTIPQYRGVMKMLGGGRPKEEGSKVGGTPGTDDSDIPF